MVRALVVVSLASCSLVGVHVPFTAPPDQARFFECAYTLPTLDAVTALMLYAVASILFAERPHETPGTVDRTVETYPVPAITTAVLGTVEGLSALYGFSEVSRCQRLKHAGDM